MRDPSLLEWEKFRKYASWMRELEFLEGEDEISQEVFDMLHQGSQSDPLCPRLLKLSWIADPIVGGGFSLFLSPQLQDVYLASRPGTRFPFSHAISALPASTLKSLRLSVVGDGPVREAIVSMLRTCGKSLTTLEVSCMDQLRDGSLCRIIFLPRLRSLETDQLPPSMFPPSLPVFFPSLRYLTLRGHASGWVRFLAADSVQRISSDSGSQPRRVAPHLVQLYCDYGAELDPMFTSNLRIFRNLSVLVLGNGCSRAARCTFRLADEDISRLAIELPGLRELSLGIPCPYNTCGTTVNSLLVLSTHCKGLRELCVHFNTLRFAQDMRDSLHNPLRRNSHPPPRCPLTVLDVGLTPLTAGSLGEDVFSPLAGLVDIFPKLRQIRFYTLSPRTSWGWRQLGAQIPGFQEMRQSLPAVFTQ